MLLRAAARPHAMRFLIRYFLRGLLIVVPLAVTVWILSTVFFWLDGLLDEPLGGDLYWDVPYTDIELRHGVGVLALFAAITTIGLLTSSVIVRYLVRKIDDVFTHLPIVKLIYSAIKDMIEAFVSEKKKFDKPVLLSFTENPEVEVIGFVTRDSLAEFGRPDQVAVYVPQSYNFAANLILVPTERVTPIDLPAAEVMTFVVSGGVSGGVSGAAEADPDDDVDD
jgi:uncharacterized membrane protein